MEWGDSFESMESLPLPTVEPDAAGEGAEMPEAPAMPSTATGSRPMTFGARTSRTGMRVKRSHAARAASMEEAEPGSFPVKLAGPRRLSPLPSPQLEQPEIGTGRVAPRYQVEYPTTGVPAAPHPAQRWVTPAPAIQFGDQFGKSARSRFRGATFR
jgi:hypothetical protein